MPVVNISEAAPSLSRFVAALESGTETEIVITRNGRATAKLVAIKPAQIRTWIGIAKGKFVVPDRTDAGEPAIARLFAI